MRRRTPASRLAGALLGAATTLLGCHVSTESPATSGAPDGSDTLGATPPVTQEGGPLPAALSSDGGVPPSGASADAGPSIDAFAQPLDAGPSGLPADGSADAFAANADVTTPASGGSYGYFYDDGENLYGVPAGGGTAVSLDWAPYGHSFFYPLVFSANVPAPVVWDTSRVYYAMSPTNPDGGPMTTGYSLRAIPVGGGTATTLATGLDEVWAIAIDASYLYFLDQAGANTNSPQGKIERIALAGGTPEVLATGAKTFAGIAVDSTYVYWTQTDANQNGQLSSNGEIMRVPLGGGSPQTVASSQPIPMSIAVDSTGIYWLNYGTNGSGDCTSTTGALEKLSPGSTAPTTIAAGIETGISLFLTSGNVYWSAIGSYCKEPSAHVGGVFEIPSGAASVRTLATSLGSPSDLYVDSKTVYFTTIDDPQTGAVSVNTLPR